MPSFGTVRFRQMRRRRLQLGSRCAGTDARLCSDHDAVVLYLTYAIAALVTIYASLQIFIKMNAGEEGIVKEILMVVGACMFMIGASIVFPAFFGYQV